MHLIIFIQQIEGDVYRVDQKKLTFLDQFEDYPTFYSRKIIKVVSVNDVTRSSIKKLNVWVYILSQFKSYLLSLPFYSNYNSFGPHNLPFVKRSNRPTNDPHGLAKSQVKEYY